VTFDEFISAICDEHVAIYEEDAAMAFIETAEIETVLRALETRGVTRHFLKAIQKQLAGKVSQVTMHLKTAHFMAASAPLPGFPGLGRPMHLSDDVFVSGSGDYPPDGDGPWTDEPSAGWHRIRRTDDRNLRRRSARSRGLTDNFARALTQMKRK
jgi:hypothetical protein